MEIIIKMKELSFLNHFFLIFICAGMGTCQENKRRSTCVTISDKDCDGSKAACLSECKDGNARSCWALGHMWSGRSFAHCGPRNEKKVRYYYRRACEDLISHKSSAEGCMMLGLDYEKSGKPEEITLAKHYYQKACDRKSAKGCYSFSILVRRMEKNVDLADKLNQKASDLGYIFARLRVNYKKGCENNNAKDCYLLSELIRKREGIDYLADELLVKACNLGYTKDCISTRTSSPGR